MSVPCQSREIPEPIINFNLMLIPYKLYVRAFAYYSEKINFPSMFLMSVAFR